jgi:hypothetical protein
VRGERGPVVFCESCESQRRTPGVFGEEALLGRDVAEEDVAIPDR